MGEIAERVIRKNKENNQNILTISAQFGLISQLEFFNKSVSAKDVTGYYLLHKNDFAYNKSYSNGYPMGAIKRLNRYEKGVVSTLYICFKFIDCIDNTFVEQSFETGNQNSEIEKVAQEGARNHGLLNIGVSDFFNIKLIIPSLPEQIQIASFLTLIDERIQCQNKIIEGLKSLKVASCKKIFSRELSFKDDNGEDFTEWEEKNGGDLFDSISNKNHNSDLPILAISQEFGAVPREMINYQISVTDKSIESYKVVEVGDFIISLRSFQGGIEYSNYKGICSPAYIILHAKVLIDNTFYKYYFKTDLYIQQLCSKLEGIRDGKMISYKYFSEITLPFPSLPEQNKIANFLSGIDEKITIETSLLRQLKLQKQYLLRQMFI